MTSTEKVYTGPRLPDNTTPPTMSRLRWSAFLVIGVPAVLLAIYLFFVAAGQYVSEARFGLRAGSQTQVAGAGSQSHPMAGAAGMTTELFVDAFAVVDYVKSRQIVQELDKTLDLRKMWSRPALDFWYGMDKDDTEEGLWRQWNRMVDIQFRHFHRRHHPEGACLLGRGIAGAGAGDPGLQRKAGEPDVVEIARG